MTKTKTIIIFLTVFFGVLGFGKISLAAPTISGVSGTVSNGLAITISGSGFGTKSPAAPVKWDDFSNGINGNQLNTTIWSVQTAFGGSTYPTYSNSMLRAGSTMSCKTVMGVSGQWNCAFGYDGPGKRQWYISYWRYDIATGSLSNFKRFRIYGNGSGDLPQAAFTELGGPTNNVFGIWAENGSEADRTYTVTGNYNTWTREEFYFDAGTRGNTDGSCKLWRNASLIVDWAFPAPALLAGYSGELAWPRIGHYLSSTGNMTSYFSEVYIDNTQARVELGNTPTWNACTHREIQIPTTWSANSITFTLNQGSFPNGSTAYLYVVDSAGAVNADGYTITIGGGSDSTPPTISGVSASSITSNSATISWTTNEASDSQVEYGLTTSYDNTTPLNTSMITSHSVNLTGLSASTLYHYRVKSRDVAGNLVTSGDYTLTTTVAVPTISSVSGTFSDGQSVTISGSEFGTNGAAGTSNIQWLGSNIEAGTVEQKVSLPANWSYVDDGGGFTAPRYSDAQAHSGNKSILTARPNENYWGSVFRYDGGAINSGGSIYVSFWVKFYQTSGWGQWKIWRLSSIQSSSDNNPEICFFDWMNDATYYGMKQLYIRATGSEDSNYLSPATVPGGNWTRIEYYAVASDIDTPNGEFHLWHHVPDTAIYNPYTNSALKTYADSGKWRYLHFGHYFGNGFTIAGAYFDDVFVQYGTQARIEIGDASTWGACTHREIQIPSAWSLGSVTFTANQGSFQNGSMAYLYVVDENGNVNENGYPVTFSNISYNRADTNQDGCISIAELSAFIDRWKMDSTAYPIRELIEAIGLWKRGC